MLQGQLLYNKWLKKDFCTYIYIFIISYTSSYKLALLYIQTCKSNKQYISTCVYTKCHNTGHRHFLTSTIHAHIHTQTLSQFHTHTNTPAHTHTHTFAFLPALPVRWDCKYVNSFLSTFPSQSPFQFQVVFFSFLFLTFPRFSHSFFIYPLIQSQLSVFFISPLPSPHSVVVDCSKKKKVRKAFFLFF